MNMMQTADTADTANTADTTGTTCTSRRVGGPLAQAMTALGCLLVAMVEMVVAARSEREQAGERGDVPGWVMVTVMTAGLVAAIWALAGPALESMLREALSSVS